MNQKLYVVISYKTNLYSERAEIKVNGIYPTIELAKERQMSILDNSIKRTSDIELHINIGNNGYVSWIKEANMGDLDRFDLRPGY